MTNARPPSLTTPSQSWRSRLLDLLTPLLPFRRPTVTPVRVEGACRMTGNCCRNLILVDRGRPVETPRQFRRLLRRMPSYTMFRANDGPHPDGWMRFRCSNLGSDNRCTIHETRPDICREYPQVDMFAKGGTLLAGCGYRLVREVRGESFQRVLANVLGDGHPKGSAERPTEESANSGDSPKWGEDSTGPAGNTRESLSFSIDLYISPQKRGNFET